MKEPTNRLSAELRRLRVEAGLSGMEAGERAGLTQAKVSRTETGAFMPTSEEVESLCRAYDAPAELRRELVAMAFELREERVSGRETVEQGSWQLQERYGRIEALSGRIRDLKPCIITGLLQTRAYITAIMAPVLAPDDVERTVAARLARRDLLDTDRQFEVLFAEGALRWNMCGAAAMVEQLDALIEDSRRSNVRLGVIPWTTITPVSLRHTYDIFDSRAVIFGTQSHMHIVTKPDEVERFEQHWATVERYASYDDEARAIIRRVQRDYQSVA